MKKEKEEAAPEALVEDKEPETIEEWADAVKRGDATAKNALAAYEKEGKVVLVSLKAPTLTIVLEPEGVENNIIGGKLLAKKIPGKVLEFEKNKAVISKADYKKYLDNGNIHDPKTRYNGIDFIEEGAFREKLRHPESRKWAIKAKETLASRRQVVDQKTNEQALDFETIMEEFHPNRIGGVIEG